LFYFKFVLYPRTILSDELTNTSAAEIGTITIITAKKMLLRKALSEGVINLTFYRKFDFEVIIA